jgi:outer membrane protein OmpA-like peptidoglycan-associated protein
MEMNGKKSVPFTVAVALLMGTTGCGLLSPPTQREEMAAYGGLAGGLTGAVIGSFVGSAVAGGLVGMPLGAVAGYYIGDNWRARTTQEAKANAKDTELAQLREENERLKQQAARAASSAAGSEKSSSAVASAKPAAKPAESSAERLSQKVLFDFNKTTMSPEAKETLTPVVAILNGPAEPKRVTLEGYSDSVGTDSYNQALSEKRSNAVKNYLIQNGVKADKITAKGMGEANPVASNDTEAGRRQNRRVEIVIVDDVRTAAAKDQ